MMIAKKVLGLLLLATLLQACKLTEQEKKDRHKKRGEKKYVKLQENYPEVFHKVEVPFDSTIKGEETDTSKTLSGDSSVAETLADSIIRIVETVYRDKEVNRDSLRKVLMRELLSSEGLFKLKDTLSVDQGRLHAKIWSEGNSLHAKIWDDSIHVKGVTVVDIPKPVIVEKEFWQFWQYWVSLLAVLLITIFIAKLLK